MTATIPRREQVNLLLRLYLPLVLALVAAGCTTRPVLPGPGTSMATPAVDHWHLEGKLGFRDAVESGSAWIDWRQQGEAFQVLLNGPFGAGATRISGDRRHALLQQAGQDEMTAAGAADLALRLFGWPFPVDQLRFWATGIPDPDLPVTESTSNDSGVLTSLEQAGWHLDFSRHSASGEWLLPGKISGSSPMGQFTLVIKRWTVD